MRTRSILFALLVLVLLSAAGYLFIIRQADTTARQPSGSGATATPDLAAVSWESMTTKDGRVKFSYPEKWYLKETTVPDGGSGQFGPIFQSFVLQSFQAADAGQGGIPEDAAKIDIEIQTGGQNLPVEDLVDCRMKTVSCEKIGIDNEQFIRSEQVLNTGMTLITLATFYDDKILRMSALINAGPGSEENKTLVSEIFNSITFTPQP